MIKFVDILDREVNIGDYVVSNKAVCEVVDLNHIYNTLRLKVIIKSSYEYNSVNDKNNLYLVSTEDVTVWLLKQQK